MTSFSGRSVSVIPMDKIRVDERYQRQLSKTSLKRIRVNYNPAALRCITCNLRKDGFYYIVDGMHRYTVAAENGETEMLAEVHNNLSSKKEAELFILLNNSKNVTRVQKFKAGLFAGSPDEKIISSIVKSNGFMFNLSPGRSKNKQPVLAVGSIQDIYSLYGGTVLSETLSVINNYKVDGTISHWATHYMFVRGIANFINIHGKPNKSKLNKIKQLDPEQVVKTAQQNVIRNSEVELEISKYLKGL